MEQSFDFLGKHWKKMESQIKAGFFAGLLIGFASHIFIITNKITNWDDVSLPPTTGGSCYFGRWLTDVTHDLFSDWGATGLNGVMAIIFLSLLACMVIRILKIRSMTGAVLVAGLLVSMPAWAGTMTFTYVSSVYGLAAYLAGAAVFLTGRYRFGFIPAVILLMDSMAIYQTYFPLATGLSVMAVLLLIIEGADVKTVLMKGLRYLGTLAAGMAAYLISVKVSGYEQTDYKGFNDISSHGISDYAESVARAYHRVLQYFVTDQPSFCNGLQEYFNIGVVLLIMICVVILILSQKLYQKPLLLGTFIVLCGLMPLSAGLIFVMSVETQDASASMIYPFVLIYLMLVFLAEHTGNRVNKAAPAVLLCMCLLCLTVFCNYRVCNNAYYRSYIAGERVKAFYNRIMAKVEMQDGYEYGQPVAILGDWWPEPNILEHFNMDGYRYEDIDSISMENGLFSTGVRYYYIRTYLGIDITETETEQGEELMATKEYQEMPCWPSNECVRKIGDTWVVKMTEDAE